MFLEAKLRRAPGLISCEVLILLLSRRLSALLLIVIGASAAAGCRTAGADAGPPIVQPGAPGESSRIIGVDEAVDLSRVRHTPADVRFMQGMIGHHAQALEMAALLPTRSASEDMRRLAQRLEASQADEIAMMQDWLTRRGERAPDLHAHHAPGAALMPGMLTAEELGRLAASKGVEFDRVFLALMIKHHEGALLMVEALFSTPGAGQEAEIFAFASEVDADQRMEIDRMGAMIVTSKESSK